MVCSGGDGTLDEVVSGLMECKERIPLGYIPAGSTNDFANSLEISKDMVKAARDIIEGKLYSCDVGRFNKGNFVYIAAFGLFTDVSYETDQHLKMCSAIWLICWKDRKESGMFLLTGSGWTPTAVLSKENTSMAW